MEQQILLMDLKTQTRKRISDGGVVDLEPYGSFETVHLKGSGIVNHNHRNQKPNKEIIFIKIQDKQCFFQLLSFNQFLLLSSIYSWHLFQFQDQILMLGLNFNSDFDFERSARLRLRFQSNSRLIYLLLNQQLFFNHKLVYMPFLVITVYY